MLSGPLKQNRTRKLWICRSNRVVPGGGVEPPRYQVPADFESAASASSAIPAEGLQKGNSRVIHRCSSWQPGATDTGRNQDCHNSAASAPGAASLYKGAGWCILAHKQAFIPTPPAHPENTSLQFVTHFLQLYWVETTYDSVMNSCNAASCVQQGR